jgi:cytochrome c5
MKTELDYQPMSDCPLKNADLGSLPWLSHVNIVMRTTCLIVLCMLSACAEPPTVSKANADVYATAFRQAVVTVSVQQKWARSCALCHVNGEGGAPKMGDVAAWAERRKAGDAVLMRRTLEGFNRMPALGYCMDCELVDFAAMINMMAGKP